jgi:hypothetical protein
MNTNKTVFTETNNIAFGKKEQVLVDAFSSDEYSFISITLMESYSTGIQRSTNVSMTSEQAIRMAKAILEHYNNQ